MSKEKTIYLVYDEAFCELFDEDKTLADIIDYFQGLTTGHDVPLDQVKCGSTNYSEGYDRFSLAYSRPETPEEEAERLAEDKKWKALRLKSTLEEYNRMRVKLMSLGLLDPLTGEVKDERN